MYLTSRQGDSMIFRMSEDEPVVKPASTPVTVPATPAAPTIQPDSAADDLPPRHPEIVTHGMAPLEHKTETLKPANVQKHDQNKKD